MIRIWMNHWFSTAYNIAQLIRKGDPSVYLIGTNEHEYAAYRAVCDEWYQEPVLSDEAYVEFCLRFCQKHCIDIFMPRRGFMAISRQRSLFEEIGVKVMVDKASLIDPLNRKSKAYQLLCDISELNILEHYVVTNAERFKEAYQWLHEKYGRVCFKFEQDEGGKSFRLIDNDRKGYSALFRRQNTRMTFDNAHSALSEVDSFPPMIVMPFLPDDEVSVDCLNTTDGLLMIPRIKGVTRTERVWFDEQILQMCRAFFHRFPLEAPFNVQFKYLNGIPYFLEANTRMSGGIQLACAAVDVNIPDLAVNKLLGIHKPWSICKKETYVTHVETPVVF